MQRRKKSQAQTDTVFRDHKERSFVFRSIVQVRHDSCFPPFVPAPMPTVQKRRPFHPSSVAFVGKFGRPIDLSSGSRYRKVGFGDEGK